MEKQINTNMERFIKPSLEYLKRIVDEKDVDLVSGLIDEIIYPITKKRVSSFINLSSREMQVANLIKEGKTSKEIAAGLCITQKAVDFHRLNIRKKLKINHGLSLRTFLETRL
jgi:DNA-binding CsgD family transcriptional regulator